MNLSGPFVRRPVASALIALGVVLLGLLSYGLLPVAPLPEVEGIFVTGRVTESVTKIDT